MAEKMVIIRKRPSEVIMVTEDHGGFQTGRCLACGESGWLEGLGFPAWAMAYGAHLKHKKRCPMNRLLDEKGQLKKPKKKREKR